MRRSLAPSQLKLNGSSTMTATSTPNSNGKSDPRQENGGDILIERMPLFGFLEIPKALNKQFRVPSGCIVTEKSIMLRKIKSLGPSKVFKVIQPGQLGAFSVSALQSSQPSTEEDDDEIPPTTNIANLPPHEPLVLWRDEVDSELKIEVIPELACKLRPHQREGVTFLFECTMGLRGFEGNGCILADDMGLGKTLMSITLMWTLLNQGMKPGESAVRKVIIACPTSLVGNWDNEIRKWVGDKCTIFPCKAEPKRIIKNFVAHRGKGVLIISYETQRRYSQMFASPKSGLTNPGGNCCDLLICDEAHKLKNAESGLSQSLNALTVTKRILLSGTPMQNELGEFYNMVNFCNPGVIGSPSEFRKKYERPILAAREPDASPAEIEKSGRLQKELSTIVNEFILKRGNILNAQHLPPKLVQFVCCRLSSVQESLYNTLLNSKEVRHIRDGKQTNTLNSIRQLINICSHPRMILDAFKAKVEGHEEVDEELRALVTKCMELGVGAPAPPSMSTKKSLFSGAGANSVGGSIAGATRGFPKQATGADFALIQRISDYIDPEQSGKLFVLVRLMQTLRAMKQGERIVVVSNYTQTLDLIEGMCRQNNWPVLRLDGSTAATKRTKLVDEFNNPFSGAFAFLLSSKAGGCGINLIGGSRLVLFDPDWNPASDKQAAGRIWREGQKRRCFIYRFMSTGTIEEKIIQRQLSKEGLQNIVDDAEQVNQFSTEELRRLFSCRVDTHSDTHDTLRCKRCKFVQDINRGGASADKYAFTEKHIELCKQYLADFESFLQEQVSLLMPTVDSTVAHELLIAPLREIGEQLTGGTFATLPLFSRRLRQVLLSMEQSCTDDEEKPEWKSFPDKAKVSAEFVSRWSALVPQLALLSKTLAAADSQKITAVKKRDRLSKSTQPTEGDNSDDDDSEDEGFVEQEGCPDDTDFNRFGIDENMLIPTRDHLNLLRWSHHSSVSTCDDEVLKNAMADDNTVSFAFGLEVNWCLLKSSEEEKREERMLKKLQAQKDLEELNERRQAEKHASRQAEEKKSKKHFAQGQQTLEDSSSGSDNEDLDIKAQICSTIPLDEDSRDSLPELGNAAVKVKKSELASPLAVIPERKSKANKLSSLEAVGLSTAKRVRTNEFSAFGGSVKSTSGAAKKLAIASRNISQHPSGNEGEDSNSQNSELDSSTSDNEGSNDSDNMEEKPDSPQKRKASISKAFSSDSTKRASENPASSVSSNSKSSVLSSITEVLSIPLQKKKAVIESDDDDDESFEPIRKQSGKPPGRVSPISQSAPPKSEEKKSRRESKSVHSPELSQSKTRRLSQNNRGRNPSGLSPFVAVEDHSQKTSISPDKRTKKRILADTQVSFQTLPDLIDSPLPTSQKQTTKQLRLSQGKENSASIVRAKDAQTDLNKVGAVEETKAPALSLTDSSIVMPADPVAQKSSSLSQEASSWTCSICTYMNHSDTVGYSLTMCLMCSSQRRMSRSRRSL